MGDRPFFCRDSFRGISEGILPVGPCRRPCREQAWNRTYSQKPGAGKDAHASADCGKFRAGVGAHRFFSSPKPAIHPTRDGQMHGCQTTARLDHRTFSRRAPASRFIFRLLPCIINPMAYAVPIVPRLVIVISILNPNL